MVTDVTTWLMSENRYYMKERALWDIWQDFGVVGIPATDSAGSIRVYRRSTASPPPPPPPPPPDCRYV